jgi:hypothetical protein
MTSSLSLSHGSMYTLQGGVDDETLREAVEKTIIRHPMLQAFISKDDLGKERFALFKLNKAFEFSRMALTTVEVVLR